jgi:hypothetical protein
MPSFSNFYDRSAGKRVIQLLALLLALAVAIPVLLAEDSDHDHNNGRDHGRFVDPIVGSWIIHVTVVTFTPTPSAPPPFKFDNLLRFGKMASLPLQILVSVLVMASGKRLAPRTYDTKFLVVVPPGLDYPPGTIQTIFAEHGP